MGPLPTSRDVVADLVRAVGIVVVVLGHWTVVAVTETDGTLDGVNAIGDLWWAPPLSWVVQVMPLFFFVGGFANAGSWQRHRQAGGDAWAWIVRRFRRLLVPAAALLGLLAATVAVVTAAGADAELTGTGAWVATVPLWFLAVYLVAIAATPAGAAVQRRVGLGAPAALLGWVVAMDLGRFHLDAPALLGDTTYVAAWLGIFALGGSWWHGRLPARTAVGVPLAVAAFALLWVLTTMGPYSVSMVAAPGQAVRNTEPPTVALCVLALGQIGALLTVHAPLTRWLRRRPDLVRRVSKVQAMVLTLFLWHMAAAVVAVVALYGSGLVPPAPVGSGAWYAWRVPWLAGCALVLAVFTVAFGGLERRSCAAPRIGRLRGGWADAAAVVGAAASLAAMVGIALAGSGSHGPFGLPTMALGSFALGAVLLAVAARTATALEVVETPRSPT
ncbi:MAG: acyltransferase family protein [Acidimicrobiia bacterium]|nr:acyltransferase family protein [Acidimicrobiia bacterium]